LRQAEVAQLLRFLRWTLIALTIVVVSVTPFAMFLILMAIAVGSQQRFEWEILLHFEALASLPLLAIGFVWAVVLTWRQ
jgi:hypothetical protein